MVVRMIAVLAALITVSSESAAAHEARESTTAQEARADTAAAANKRRVQVRGFVRDFEGRPWTGAKLSFYSSLPLTGTRRMAKDAVEVPVDQRGRFEASLLKTRRYMAFASEELGGGLWRCSAVELVAPPARRLVFREQAKRYAKLSLRLDEPTKGRLRASELLVRAPTLVGGASFGAALLGRQISAFSMIWRLRIEDSKCELPLLPCDHVSLEVLDARGLRVAHAGLALAKDLRERDYRRGVAIDTNPLLKMIWQSYGAVTLFESMSESILKLHPASKVEVELRDSSEKALAASLFQFVDGRRVAVAEADARGVARFDLPVRATSSLESMQRVPAFHLFAEAQGFAVTCIRKDQQHNPFVAAMQGAAGGTPAQAMQLTKRASVTGRLMKSKRKLGRLALAYRCRVPRGRLPFGSSNEVWNDLISARCDADGRFALDRVERGTHFELYALLDDDLAESLAVRAGPALLWSGKVDRAREIGELDLEALRVVGRVVRADGSPEHRACVQLLLSQAREIHALASSALTDAQGRFALLLPRSADDGRRGLQCAVIGREGYAFADAEGVEKTELRLPDLRLNVRALNGDAAQEGVLCSSRIRLSPATNPEMFWLQQAASALFSGRSGPDGRCSFWRYAGVPIVVAAFSKARKQSTHRVRDDEAKREITLRL